MVVGGTGALTNLNLKSSLEIPGPFLLKVKLATPRGHFSHLTLRQSKRRETVTHRNCPVFSSWPFRTQIHNHEGWLVPEGADNRPVLSRRLVSPQFLPFRLEYARITSPQIAVESFSVAILAQAVLVFNGSVLTFIGIWLRVSF